MVTTRHTPPLAWWCGSEREARPDDVDEAAGDGVGLLLLAASTMTRTSGSVPDCAAARGRCRRAGLGGATACWTTSSSDSTAALSTPRR